MNTVLKNASFKRHFVLIIDNDSMDMFIKIKECLFFEPFMKLDVHACATLKYKFYGSSNSN